MLNLGVREHFVKPVDAAGRNTRRDKFIHPLSARFLKNALFNRGMHQSAVTHAQRIAREARVVQQPRQPHLYT